jgi:hypothetical protein
MESAIQASYNAYLEHGARSSKKLIPLHSYLAETLRPHMPSDTRVYADLGEDAGPLSGEVKVSGAYYPKNIDVTGVCGNVRKTGKKQITLKEGAETKFCLGVKFITSNYHQNKNNYFESMIGETSNIQATGVPYAQFLVIPTQIPYFNSKKVLQRFETFNGSELAQYVKLAIDAGKLHSPFFIGVKLVDINYETKVVTLLEDTHLDELYAGATKLLSWDKHLSDLAERLR